MQAIKIIPRSKGTWALLAIAALVPAYIGYEVMLVRLRQLDRDNLVHKGIIFVTDEQIEMEYKILGLGPVPAGLIPELPWLRKQLGDTAIVRIKVPVGWPKAEMDQLRLRFPEANVVENVGRERF
jgi:hypothetical protein